jgi:two-component system sensor histidine kinase KdpD
MNSRRLLTTIWWLSTLGALAGIVLVYRFWLHVNPTTVALTLLLFVLIVAARLSLRYALVVSIAATACYNFYFLPPVGTFTIADPQNWLALFAFLATSVIGSRLSQRARDEAHQARTRQRELEILFALSRELLQTENVAELVNILPTLVNTATRAQRSTLYLLDGDRLYQAGTSQNTTVELPHFRHLALSLHAPETAPGGEVYIPLRAGVRPRGLLRLDGLHLSDETLQAIGGLASIALDRAQALEEVARSEANKESERLRTLILDSITHELRTPLTSIKGATGTLLAMDHLKAEDRRELLTIVEEEADRLNRLVGQAVEMAQIETQEVHMSFAPMDLREIVAEAQESCSWVAATHPITISIPALPGIRADRVMIAKVLCNLLENAAKYSAPHSPIFISAEARDGHVVTSIADRGVGIDPSEQGLIFDRLYRSRAHSQQKPGTGMGLAISRAIIESHHGKLTVTSQINHGSVFSFSIPLAH